MADTNTPDAGMMSRYDFNGLATWPYELRQIAFLYRGDALTANGRTTIPFGWFITVPPNETVVITASGGERVVLPAGRHSLNRALKGKGNPTSAQFVSVAQHTWVLRCEVYTLEHVNIGLDLQVTMRVSDPATITGVTNPKAALTGALQQVALNVTSTMRHAEVRSLLAREIDAAYRAQVATMLKTHGLEVLAVWLVSIRTNAKQDELERQKAEHIREHELTLEDLHRKREQAVAEYEQKQSDFELRKAIAQTSWAVRMMEAQLEEDVFAIQQPGFRRKLSGDLNAAMRQQNFEARIKTIEAAKEMAQGLMESMRNHPGRLHTEEDTKVITQILGLLQEMSKPVASPPIPNKVRSRFAMDNVADPAEPPIKWPLASPVETIQELPTPELTDLHD